MKLIGANPVSMDTRSLGLYGQLSQSVSGSERSGSGGVFGHQRSRLKVSRSNCALPVLVVLVLAVGWWSLMSRGEAAGRPPGAAQKPPSRGRGRAAKVSEMCEEFEVVVGSKDEKLKAAFAFRGLGAYFLGYVLVFSLPLTSLPPLSSVDISHVAACPSQAFVLQFNEASAPPLRRDDYCNQLKRDRGG